jgi:hypothetical protein
MVKAVPRIPIAWGIPELAKNQLSITREERGDIGMERAESKESTKEKIP